MKICFVTTVSITLRAFVLPTLEHLVRNTDWQITVICDDDPTFEAALPQGVRYIPVSMKRGISLGGIGAMLKMWKIFRQEKFDLVQYSTPNASLYASMAAKLAGVPSEVVSRARKILGEIEGGEKPQPKRRFEADTFDMVSAIAHTEAEEAAELIRATDINTLTPIEAINLIYDLKKIIKT